MKVPPPLDVHAHLASDVSATDLRELGAFIFGMTRSLAEFATVQDRHDLRVIWSVGVHPGLVRAQRAFDITVFAEAVAHTPLVGEVGLDANGRVPMRNQIATLREIFEVLVERPHIVSVHSAGAQMQVLRLLHEFPIRGVVLHWWTGSIDLTEEAVRLGCYFSLPPASMSSHELLAAIPSRRMLPETDHPYGDRRTPAPRRPGGTGEVEHKVGATLRLGVTETRLLFWRNLASLIGEVDLKEFFGPLWQEALSHVASGG